MRTHVSPVPAYALATISTTSSTVLARPLHASCAFPVSFLWPEQVRDTSPPSTPRSQGGSGRLRQTLSGVLRERDRGARRGVRRAQASASSASRPTAAGAAARWKQRLNAGLDWLDRYWERRDEEQSTRYHGGW